MTPDAPLTPETVEAIASAVVRRLAAEREWPALLTGAGAARFLGYCPRVFAVVASYPTFPRRVSVPGGYPRYRTADLRKWLAARPVARVKVREVTPVAEGEV